MPFYIIKFKNAATENDSVRVNADDPNHALQLFQEQNPDCSIIGCKVDRRGGGNRGAGRKPGLSSRPTKPVRVPLEWADKIDEIDDLLNLIQDWKDLEASAHPDSRDWVQMRRFLKDADKYLDPCDSCS